MTAAHPHDQLPRMLHHTTGKVDQRKPDRLQALAHPLVSQHQPLHRGIEGERKHRDPPPRRILPKRPTGKLPPRQVLLENPVHLLALPATPPVPPDQFLPVQVPVRHDPEPLVRAAPHLHRRERKIPLRLPIPQPPPNREPLPDRQKPVRRILLAVLRKPRNEADLRKLLVRLLAPATPLAEQRPPLRFLHLRHRLFELQRHRSPHRKTDHPEPLVRPLGAIAQQIISVTGCIAAEKHLLHAFRKTRKGLLQNPHQIVVRRNVPVTKLRVRHNPLLRPVHRQRLGRTVMLVAEQRLLLLRLHQRRVHVQSRCGHRMPPLHKTHQVPVHHPQPPQCTVGHREERLTRLPQNLLRWIVKRRQVPERRRGRGDATTPILTPPTLQLTTRATTQTVPLHTPQQTAESLVPFQNPQIVHALTPRQLQQDQRGHHLRVRPPLGTFQDADVPPDRLLKTRHLRQVQIHRQPAQRRHPRFPQLPLILVRKDALRHNGFTSLVIVVCSYKHSISLIPQANEVLSLIRRWIGRSLE